MFYIISYSLPNPTQLARRGDEHYGKIRVKYMTLQTNLSKTRNTTMQFGATTMQFGAT